MGNSTRKQAPSASSGGTFAIQAPSRGDQRATVESWVECWNRRCAEGLIRLAHPDVVVLPLHLSGLDRRYDGRDGIRSRAADLAEHAPDLSIDLAEVGETEDARLIASGAVTGGDGSPAVSFSGLYEVERGLVATASHFFSSPSPLEHVGIVEAT